MRHPDFAWNDRSAREMGVRVSRLPDVVLAAMRVEEYPVPGRHGKMYVPESASIGGFEVYDEILKSCECVLMPEAHTDAVFTWLSGEGCVEFTSESGYVYRARIYNQIDMVQILRGNPHREFLIEFLCDPFRYEARPTTHSFATSTYTMRNLGTVPAAPRITIKAQGPVTLYVGAQRIDLSDVQGEAIIDTELEEAYRLGDDPALLNHLMVGNFPVLPLGDTIIRHTGAVTRVEIAPNWRWR